MTHDNPEITKIVIRAQTRFILPNGYFLASLVPAGDLTVHVFSHDHLIEQFSNLTYLKGTYGAAMTRVGVAGLGTRSYSHVESNGTHICIETWVK